MHLGSLLSTQEARVALGFASFVLINNLPRASLLHGCTLHIYHFLITISYYCALNESMPLGVNLEPISSRKCTLKICFAHILSVMHVRIFNYKNNAI